MERVGEDDGGRGMRELTPDMTKLIPSIERLIETRGIKIIYPNWNAGNLAYDIINHPSKRSVRRAIFQKDDWTCQICGGKINPDSSIKYKKLVSHHIKYPPEEINDLVTLHFGCHRKLHTFLLPENSKLFLSKLPEKLKEQIRTQAKRILEELR